MRNSRNGTKIDGKMKRALLLIISAVVAIALGLTCALFYDVNKPASVDGVSGDGEVSTSAATYNNVTGDLRTNFTNGTYKPGDVFNYSYTGSNNYTGNIRSVILPKGVYTLEVWGAQGGMGMAGSLTTGDVGGKGGYSKGTVTFTADTTMYIVIGGRGRDGYGSGNPIYYGGYNGGGTARGDCDSNGPAGSGGGATHMATASGVLSALNGNRNAVLIVGGGGGGGGSCSAVGLGGYGGGGNNNGGNADNRNGYAATGGTTNGTPTGGAGGSGSKPFSNTSGYSDGANTGVTGRYVTQIRGANGSFGRGGDGGGPTNDSGAGGGGGWFGGGGGAGRSGGESWHSAAGGSGYIRSDLANKGGQNGAREGHGYARFTIVKITDPPATKNAIIQGGARGANKSVAVAPSVIAEDPDGSPKTNVYFTDGVTNAYDTLTTGNNVGAGKSGLFLNSACTTLATDFIDWRVVNSSQILITNIKRYPRANTGGNTSTVNGDLVLYAKVRDNYGSTSKARTMSVIKFTLRVSDGAINVYNNSTAPAAANVEKVADTRGTYVQYTYGTGLDTYNYRLGNSDKTDTVYDYANNGHIYNTTEGVPTVFIPQPLTPNRTGGFTVYAKDIYYDADTAYDVVGIDSVSNASNTYYTITKNLDTATYGSTGLGASITIKPTSQRPTASTYVALTVTAKTCETATKAVIGSANTTVRLVFKIANTRPYYASSSAVNTGIAKEPYAELYMDEDEALGHKNYIDININEIAYDLDGTTPSFVTRATADAPQFIKVPTNEFIAVTRENALVALKNTSNYFDNNKADNIIGTDETNAPSWFTGEGGIATGFNSRVLADANDSAAVENACITYQYIGTDTLRLTARAATQNMYKTSGRTGDFYIMVRVSDVGDAGDYGIWFPIAVKVHSSAPRTPTSPASFTLGFDEYTQSKDGTTVAGAGNAQGVDVTPLGYNVDGVLNGIGTQTSGDVATIDKQSKPFVTDNDIFRYTPYNADGTLDTNISGCERELNDVVMLRGNYAVGDVINADDETAAFFKLTVVKLYANSNVFKGLSASQRTTLGITPESGTSYSSFMGFRITPVRATDNYYFRYDVPVVDSHGVTADVPVYVKVENRTLNRRLDIAYDDNGTPNNFDEVYSVNTTSYGKFESDASLVGDKYINYTVKKSDVIRITPYDLAYDFDTPYEFNGNESNIGATAANPEDTTGFAAAADIITKNYSTIRRTLSPDSDPADEPFSLGTKAQQLTFTNTESLKSSIRIYKNYLGAVGTDAGSSDEEISNVVKESVTVDGTIYAVPCIEIEAKSRTGSGLLTLRFSVSDGYTSINYVISVTVLNAEPMLADNQVGKCHRMTAGTSTSDIVPNSWMFRVDEVAKDIDGDILSFISGSVRIVTLVNGEYVATAFDSLGNEYALSQFIDAVLTKNDKGVDVILVTARSSTQLFETPVFVEFNVTDGYRAQPRISTLHVQLEVENTDPALVTTELIIDENNNFNWDIKYEDTAEKTMERYIVNSAELYDYIPVSASNKIMLFNDADATQYALLNPYNGFPENDNENHTSRLVAKYVGSNGLITSDAFAGVGVADPETQNAYKSAAVLYTPTYTAGTTENNDTYIKLDVVYYEKTAGGTFSELSATSGEKIKKSNYWAIRIVDTCNSSEVGKATQIAIAIKDNHHGNDIYEGNRDVVSDHSSDVTVCNFYYRYLSPGLTVMHEYYRSDGKVDASTIVTGKTDEYVLDINALNSSNHGYLFKDGVVPSSQNALQEATYADDYKYLYFANTKRTTEDTPEGKKTKVEFVPKVFASSSDNAFYYKPVEVSGSVQQGAETVNNNVATVMPISYIAMPTGYNTESGTENGTHVIFGNAYTSQQGSQNTLYDNGSEYVNWNEAVVFQNLTLTDSAGNEWSGRYTEQGKRLNDNPYIDIKYIATPTVLGGTLVNKNRYGVSANNTIAEFDWKVAGTTDTSKFREDKFGFSFTRKRNSERPSGLLKLTVELKTNDAGSAAVSVPVEISVENSSPVHVKYGSEFSYYLNNLSVKMRTSDSDGKYVELLRDKTTSVLDPEISENIDKFTVKYEDYDSTDVMKFLMATATDKTLASELSATDYAYIKDSSHSSTYAGWHAYFDNAASPDYDTFVPNPGYKNFFDVSPENGAASVLQFFPTAKTDIDLTGKSNDEIKEILDLNHLAIDTDGSGNYVKNSSGGYDIYYPYKILFYDDLNGDGITNGKMFTAIIKVYIVNDEIKANSTVAPNEEYTEGGERVSYATYNFSLTKNINSSVDVSSLLIDNDIVLTDDAGTFAVADSDEWTRLAQGLSGKDLIDVSKNKQLVKDYLIMPTDLMSSDKVLEGSEKIGSISVKVSGTSQTTLIFTAASAFSGNISIKYTFKDSRGESVIVVFKISYRNEAPKANKSTFGGSDTISIVMHTNDTVVFHVADSNEFSVDTKGGFKSPTYFGYAQSGNTNVNSANAGNRRNSEYYGSGFDYPTTGAKAMLDNFGYFANTIDDSTKTGNELIIAEDDAASTLRFMRSPSGFPVGSFSTAGSGNAVDFTRKFEVKAYNTLATESSCGQANIEQRAMTVSVKAIGVVTNAIYTLPVSDNGTTTEIRVIITVLPSAPTVDEENKAGLGRPGTALEWIKPDADVKQNQTYNVTLQYGDVKDIRLSSFMKDVDMDDSSEFYMPDIYGGSCFKISNNVGVNAVTAEQISNDAGIKFLRLHAIDYIPVEGEYVTLTFKVSDAHGATSDEIVFKVYVAPRDMSVVASSISREYEFNIMSYADYVADGDENTAIELDLVSASGGAIINDGDCNAPSALYDVAVYARFYLEEEEGTENLIPREYKNMTEFNEAFSKNKYELHIADVIQEHGSDSFGIHYSNNDRANYVKRFFDIIPTEDGKKLLFTPKSATIGATGGLDKLRFCIKIGKQYKHSESDGSLTSTVYTTDADAFVRISVANSAPVAMVNSSINYGYPLLENDVNRQANFLSFRGSKGDELTWKLFDRDDEYFGLFYDYDMINVDEGKGRETLSYASARVLATYTDPETGTTYQTPSDAMSTTDPVLLFDADKNTFTITIKRKVNPGIPGPDGAAASTVVPVEVSCTDVIGSQTAPATTVKTVILVTVENDTPDFKQVSSDNLKYTIEYDDFDGYVMRARIRTGETLNVRLADIIDDADIDMDAYFFRNTNAENCFVELDVGASRDIVGVTSTGASAALFSYTVGRGTNAYNTSTINEIRITCKSAERGATATAELSFFDSTRVAHTSRMKVYLTVDNTAPVAISSNKVITLMGLKMDASEDEIKNAIFQDNIINYITDINPNDAVDAEKTESNTYVYISGIEVYLTGSVDAPILYGPGIKTVSTDPVTGETTEIEAKSVCTSNWTDTDYHQKFSLTLAAGVYGTQKVRFTVSDGGYYAGTEAGVNDYLETFVDITVIVTCPIDTENLPEFGVANKVKRKVTPALLLNKDDEDHKHAADGYTIKNITVADGSPLTVTSEPAADGSDATDWFVTANYVSGAPAEITVTFDVGGKEVVQVLTVNITENHAPVLKIGDSVMFSKGNGDLDNNNMVVIKPTDWFEDPDIDDIMRFVSPVKTKVSAYVDAHIDGGNIVLKFNGRGSTELTLNITDLSGTLYKHTIIVGSTDIPELNTWNTIVAKIQSNPLMWGLIAGGILLLIILLIIIIVVVRKKRRIRLEIEALLASEAELEEDMLRLSGGAVPYRSYGYLPPTTQTMQDPNLMLGTQAAPPPNSLQLNAGVGPAQGAQPTADNPAPQQNASAPISNDGFNPDDF